MIPSEYPRIFEFETSHWWFRGLHNALLQTWRELGTRPGGLIVDAGCGTGGLLARLREEGRGRIVGFDLSVHASRFWSQRGLSAVFRASVDAIPLPSESADVVFCINVFECDEVEPAAAYAELWRITRPGGHLILSMPAHHWLGSKKHDAAVVGSRRFTRRETRALLQSRPVSIGRITHLFPLFLVPIAAWRGVRGVLGGSSDGPPQTDLSELPKALNAFLLKITELEGWMLKHIDFPMGSSILAVARKAGSADQGADSRVPF